MHVGHVDIVGTVELDLLKWTETNTGARNDEAQNKMWYSEEKKPKDRLSLSNVNIKNIKRMQPDYMLLMR